MEVISTQLAVTLQQMRRPRQHHLPDVAFGSFGVARADFEMERSANPSITHDRPLKSISIPTNRPMTQKPEKGHCLQMDTPRKTEMMPFKSIQPQPSNRSITDNATRRIPPTRRQAAMSMVNASAASKGFSIMKTSAM